MPHTPAARYGRLSIGLHWLMLILIAATYACIELRGLFPRGSEPRDLIKQWHFMLGLAVFALVWLRLLARLLHPAPRAGGNLWQRRLAGAMHLSLYALMIGMPLLGWLILSAEGKPVPFFGLELPALVSPSESRAETFETLHEVLGVAGYWLIGLHAAAGLAHHYLWRDDTLRRMLPRLG